MRLTLPSVVASFTLLALTPSFANAADPDPAAQAEGRERFQRGVELFRDGDYRTALIEFNRANEVAPSWRIQFNIAQTCLELQDYACALRAFDRYLAGGTKEVPKDRRDLAERESARLRKLVGTLRVTANREGADVTVDDLAVGKTPLTEPLLVGAGRHKVTVVLPPLPPSTKVIDVAGGDNATVDIVLSETGSSASSTTTPSVVPPPPAPPPSRTPFWIGLGVTSALAAATTVVGILSLGAKSDLDDKAATLDVNPRDVDDAASKTKTLRTVTDVLLASTIVSAGITTVLFFTTRAPSRSGAVTVTPQVGLGAAGFRGTF